MLTFYRFFWTASLVALSLLTKAQPPRQDSLRISAIADDSTRIMQLAKAGVNLIYSEKGRYSDAMVCLQRAEREAENTGSLLLKTHVLRQRGEVEMQAGHWPVALTQFQQAERTYTQLAVEKKPGAARNRHFVLLMKLRIAQIQSDNNDFVQARRALLDALRYARQQQLTTPDDQSLIGSVYNSLSILEGKAKNQLKSLAYADTAAMQALAAGNEMDYYTFLLNTAITRKNLGQFATAVQQYTACEAFFKKQKDYFALTMVYANVPRALMGLKRYDEAIDYAKKAIAMTDQTPYRLPVQSDVNEALAQLYEAQGKPALALQAFKLSKAQQDTVFTQEKDKQIQELSAKYEAEKKEAQIQELSEKSRQRTWQLAGLGGGTLLLSLLLGLSLYQSKRLRQGTQRISKQAQQLQLLMKELHHRAKNNLAIVSGLLELQANRTDDGRTRQAFQEGQQRIQAMSMIHQRLYQTDALTAIDLRDYVSNLVQSLMHTYGYTPTTLDLQLTLEAEAVEADVAIPLGLIINELLTNAFKYAFQQVARPRLIVTLLTHEDSLLLEVADNGPGVDLVTWQRPTGSFGKQLIRSLSEQLDAELSIENRQGLHVSLNVPVAVSEVA